MSRQGVPEVHDARQRRPLHAARLVAAYAPGRKCAALCGRRARRDGLTPATIAPVQPRPGTSRRGARASGSPPPADAVAGIQRASP